MGRGRAKAKQTRVARDLKYRAVDTDFASLERELRSSDSYGEYVEVVEDIPDAYSDLADQYADYEDEDDERASS